MLVCSWNLIVEGLGEPRSEQEQEVVGLGYSLQLKGFQV